MNHGEFCRSAQPYSVQYCAFNAALRPVAWLLLGLPGRDLWLCMQRGIARVSTSSVVTAASAEIFFQSVQKEQHLAEAALALLCTEACIDNEEKISVRCRVECRHMAVLGEMACALVNPIKRRHFYLAVKSTQCLELSFWHPGQLSLCPRLLKWIVVI